MTTEEIPEASAPVAVPDDEPEPLKLTEKETLKLSRAHAESRAAKAELALLQYERAAYLARVDPEGVIRAFDSRISGKKAEVTSATQQEAAARTEIEARLGVNLSQYSYDDVTGILHELPKE